MVGLAAPLPDPGGVDTLGNPSKPRALIVDDCRTVVAIVRHYLQREGFEVLAAPDGLAGLETARREQPRVLITDLNMPGLDGPEMVRALRADTRMREMAIFMLSSDERPECREQAFAAGVDHYVLKPVDPGPFAARVRAAVDRAVKARLEP